MRGFLVQAALLLALTLSPAQGEAALFRRHDPEVEAGRSALQAQDAEAALRHFDRALSRHPDAPRLHLNRGLALQALGRVEEAEAALVQALSLGGEAQEAHHALGHLLAEAGETERALTHFRHALEFDPDDEAARRNLEALLRRQQQGSEGDEGADEGEGESDDGEASQDPEEGEDPAEDGQGEEAGQDEGEQDDKKRGAQDQRQEEGEGADGDPAPDPAGEPGEEAQGADESAGAGEPADPTGEEAGEPAPQPAQQTGREAAGEQSETERILDALQQREKGLQLWRHGQQKGKVRDGDRDW